MPYYLPNSVMLHVPKTGGQWCEAALKSSGIDMENRGRRKRRHAPRALCPETLDRFTFTFVRHPATWLQSVWAFHVIRNWRVWTDPELEPAVGIYLCKSDDFHTFVSNYLSMMPGFISDLFEKYTGAPGDEIEFVGRNEYLVDDLCAALHAAGESFNESQIRDTPPRNVAARTKNLSRLTRWDDSQLRDVCEAESQAIGRWYGDTDPLEVVASATILKQMADRRPRRK